MTAPDPAALAAYARFWVTLHPGSIGELRRLAIPDLRFKDPFHDITGIDKVEAMLQRMFAATDGARFVVLDRAMGARAGYIRWRYEATPKQRAPIALEGMSEVSFAEDGRVAAHIDHWDVAEQLYESVPFLGAILRFVKRRAAV